MSLEQELRSALERKNPASGFDDRVMSKIAAGGRPPVHAAPGRRGAIFLPIAASLMLAVATTYYLGQQSQSRDAHAHTEQTARDVVLALQIASDKVSAAQARFEEITRYEPAKND